MTDQPGPVQPRLLGGRYELGAVLGRGGMAEVRQARDLRLNRDVAIKQLRVDLATDATFQARFRREAQSAAGLNHPNIVAVYDTGEEADPATGVMVPYIVMELVEGHTLRDILRTGRQIQPARALEFVEGVLDALAYSHRAGIVHRDIKPANVMLTSQGVVKVMDFGIARAVADTSSTMTQTAAVIGTAQYLSPEQARGETVDARSDIYSTGCLMYELLTGRPPFQGDSPVSVAYQHVREQPVPPSQIDPLVTPGMDAVVLKALAKDPNDRYQTAGAMRADVARLLAGQDVLARPPMTVALPPASSVAATQVVPMTTVTPEADEGPVPAKAPRALEPEHKRRVGLWVFVAALIVVALGLGAFFAFGNPWGGQVAKVAVPLVKDQKEEQAVDALKDAGLTPSVVYIQGDDDDTVGRVTDQDPPQNTMVPVGSTVKITVNKGPKTGTIPPGLSGQDYRDAVAALLRLGFTNVESKPDPNEQINFLSSAKNTVTTISPPEGTSVSLDSPITVLYATGQSEMPYLVGMNQAEATSRLANAGFTKTPVIKTKEDATAAAGTVLEQNKKGGSKYDRSTTVTLTVAVAPPPPPPPTSATPKVTPGGTGAENTDDGTGG